MNGDRSFTFGACLAIILSVAVWGVVGRSGADSAALYEWVEWFVLEGPADVAALGLVMALSIVSAIKYHRFHISRDVGYLHGCIGASAAGLVMIVVEFGILLLRAGLIWLMPGWRMRAASCEVSSM